MNKLEQLKKQATEDILGVKILNDKLYAKLIIEECETALHVHLRDMISRGQAYDLIKEHFKVEQ